MIEVIEMDRKCTHVAVAYRYRKIYTKKQLKYKYKFANSIGCYEMAQTYLYALYGRKEPFYRYESRGGRIFAFKYPPIRA